MKRMTNRAAILVLERGSRMSRMKRKGPALSMRAASTNSPGIVRKNCRNRNVAVADAINGKVRPA
ncbi:hypothetical protein D3C87_2101920 [compost metagenome]